MIVGDDLKLIDYKHKNINIIVTDNPLNQIVSRMMAIYLRETVGHSNIIFRWVSSPNSSLNTMFQCQRESKERLVDPKLCFSSLIIIILFVLTLSAMGVVNARAIHMGTPIKFLNPQDLGDEIGDLGITQRFGWFYRAQFRG